MKRLIPTILVLVALLMVLSVAAGNTNSPANFAGNPAIYLDEDPNEPGPESGYIGSQFNCIDEDPNEPGPESGYIGGQFNCIDEDPNEPGPESA